jgi:eukaryotic-like serine/threonine-protein kinase
MPATIGHIGRYALKFRIGEGGLGTVYEAHDPLLSRLIAIKTLNLDISVERRASFNALFLNEARAAAGLSHPHIVTVFDAGVSDHNAYIAMELLKGRDLRQLRQEGWRPTPSQSALIVRRVADALAYAHSKGVVHRDVKPANIFMVGRTQPRVLDFGIARVTRQHDTHTGQDVAGGSPFYMAPEQVRQQPVDRRADVFSLGVVLYELLTDVKPFRGGSLGEITSAVLQHQPPPAHMVNRRVPKALSEITARAMEKDPALRYRSARALSRDLRHWLDEHGEATDSSELAAQASARRRVAWAGATLAAAAVAGSAWWAAGPSARWPGTQAPWPGMAASAVTAPPAASAPLTTAAATADQASDSTAPATPTEPAAAVASSAAISAEPTPLKDLAQETNQGSAIAPLPESARARPPRESRARTAKVAANTRPAALAPARPSGVLRLAVSPWGQVEVDGAAVGTAPPLNQLTLPEGRHLITIRNQDFPPYSATVIVTPGQAVSLKHKFGS